MTEEEDQIAQVEHPRFKQSIVQMFPLDEDGIVTRSCEPPEHLEFVSQVLSGEFSKLLAIEIATSHHFEYYYATPLETHLKRVVGIFLQAGSTLFPILGLTPPPHPSFSLDTQLPNPA
jgi:hypothetical protein